MGRALLWMALPAVLALASPVLGRDTKPTDPADDLTGKISVFDYWTDWSERMTVPVSIEGRGPYRFVVDTGAERTVISRELASELQLGAGPDTMMHSMTEVGSVPTVLIPALEVSDLTTRDIKAPALSRAHIGAAGMLGVDSLKAKRVTFDFKKQTMAVVSAKAPEGHWDADTIVVTARSRYGQLVLVDASVEGEKVWVVIDTGSQVTVGNEALRAKLLRKRKLKFLKPIELMSVTGGHIHADYTVAREMRIGGIDMRQLPIAFADVHPFRKLQLTERPAILLGMDSLKLFHRVSVNFATRKVRLLPPRTAGVGIETRTAARRPGQTGRGS